MLNVWSVANIAKRDVGTNRNDLMRSTEPSWLQSLKNLNLFCVVFFCRRTRSKHRYISTSNSAYGGLQSCPCGTTRLPLDGILLNFTFEYFS